MKFSLILCTLGRTTELVRFLEHLDRQTYRNFELVVVDQNPEDLLDPVLAPYRDHFQVVHVRSKQKGLSRARNLGLAHFSGDIVAFPDDDCWYSPDILEQVAQSLQRHPDRDGLTCRCVDESGSDAFNKFDSAGGDVTKYNVWQRSNSNCIFLSARFVAAARQFNEDLGRGASSATAAEEIDFLIRGIAAGLTLLYSSEIRVYHPRRARRYDEAGTQQARSDAVGQGFVLRKHRYHFPYVAYFCLRPLGGMLVALATGNAGRFRYHLAIMQGRLRGWIG
jgi:glycosyltransferase involved in cell wall biosynthesis